MAAEVGGYRGAVEERLFRVIGRPVDVAGPAAARNPGLTL